VDGSSWTADATVSAQHFIGSQHVNLIAGKLSGQEMLLSVFLNSMNTGVHPLGGQFISGTNFRPISTGTINITQLDDAKHKFAATFSFTATGSGVTNVVTNGKFTSITLDTEP